MRKVKISQYAKENNITYRTVWNMVKSGKLKSERLPSGTILVVKGFDEKDNTNAVRAVLYARVSSSENKSNLDTQMDRLRQFSYAKGWIIVKEVKEVGSGLNDKRKKLQSVLEKDDYDYIVVEHKDRFARFGVSYISQLLEKQNKKLFVINEKPDNSKEDLMQDFVSIITSFTARLYGLRRSKRKTEAIIKEIQESEE